MSSAVDPRRIYKRILTYAVLILLAYIFLFPLVFMVMSSFKPEDQIFADLYSIRAMLPVGDVSWKNYLSVFEKSAIETMFFNSVVITITTVLMSMLVNSLAAFSLSRLRWKGQNFVLAAVIALMILPFEAISVPLLMLVANLPWIGWENGQFILESSWLNSLHVQILPFVAHSFSIFLFYQFFKDIPKDFDEAAAIDGASPWKIYWKVIVPMSGPVFATVAILQFLFMWNQYLWPIMVVQGEAARPLQPGIQQFFGTTTEWGEIMAYATMVTIPVLAVFLAFQKRFVRSMAGAGVKG